MVYEDLSREIIGCFYRVQNVLGPGLLEVPYHNALFIQFA